MVNISTVPSFRWNEIFWGKCVHREKFKSLKFGSYSNTNVELLPKWFVILTVSEVGIPVLHNINCMPNNYAFNQQTAKRKYTAMLEFPGKQISTNCMPYLPFSQDQWSLSMAQCPKRVNCPYC